MTHWVCWHPAPFRENVFLFELRRLTCWNFATTQAFVKKNNWYILKCKKLQFFDFENTSFILPFYNKNFLKSRCPRFNCKVKFLSIISTFSHQCDFQNFSSLLHLSVLQHFSVVLSHLFHVAVCHWPLLYMQPLNWIIDIISKK